MRWREEILADGIRLINADCRDVLPTLGNVDAVVTDPPYGIGEAAGKAKTRIGSLTSRNAQSYRRDYGDHDWDDKPADPELIAAIIKAASHAIIFGGNYYHLPPTPCWLVWDKLNGDSDFADCELAWTNLKKAVRRINFLWNGCMKRERDIRREHPTQKPIEVMRWCIGHLPESTSLILDPFMGSGTTGCAAVSMGRKFIGIERVPSYFDVACRRIAESLRAPDLFIEPSKPAKQEAFPL